MNEQDRSEQVHQTPSHEVHREREIIVTNDGGRRGSGSSTAIVVIFALIALAVVAFLGFTFLERDGGTIVPDEIDITVEVPSTGGGS
jgi:hypothetical protein